MGEPVRELSVVREQQGAGSVGVEAADRDDADSEVDQVDHGAPALGIADGRDGSGGLVQEDVRVGLRLERAAVELDAVSGLDEGVQLARLAVHGHTAGLDQLVRPAARGDSGPREIGIQPHTRHYSP